MQFQLSGSQPFGLTYQTTAQEKPFRFKGCGSYSVVGFLEGSAWQATWRARILTRDSSSKRPDQNSMQVTFSEIDKLFTGMEMMKNWGSELQCDGDKISRNCLWKVR